METTNENKMGIMPIPKLLITMALPMMISMLVQALYNIVDSIFVARLNAQALTAVSLAFPVQNLMIAVAAGTGVGINALLSRYLGEKRFDEANEAARNGIFLGIMSCIVTAILGLFFSHLFFTVQTDNQTIVGYGTDYLQVITLVSAGVFMQITLERLLQSTGNTFYTMITQSVGAIINIIMDPILIFGLFGFPRLEVAGAAIATVFGQCVAVALSLYFNITKNKTLRLCMRGFRPNMRIIKRIYSVGVPSIIMQSIGSIMVFCMNNILLVFTETATNVFGAYFKLQSFVFMPVYGLNNGMIPIVAYNYGARQKERILKTIRLSIVLATAMMIVGFIVFQLFPTQLLSFFDGSAEMLSIGIPALRKLCFGFLLAGYCVVLSAVFQALGNGVYSLFLSAMRQLIIILPIAYLFAHFCGLSMVWWSIAIAEVATALLSTLLFRRIRRQKIESLEIPDR